MRAGFQTVHVRVNDSSTGKPTPVRIRFVGEDGTYYAPFGRLTEFATGLGEDVGGNVLLGDKKYAYIDGSCEIRLPVGMVEVEIHKGPEYLPVHQKLEIKQGKLSLRLEICRWINTRALGWYAGDTHCFGLTPHGALLEAQAEDLAVVNLLAALSHVNCVDRVQRPRVPNLEAFSGQHPALEVPGHLVAVNTHNAHAMLGALSLLNCHRPVFPLTLGGPGQVDDWNLADWCEQCHRKRGLVVARSLFPSRAWAVEGEVLTDLVLGLIDAIALQRGDDELQQLQQWHDLISCGFVAPLVAGSSKFSNRHCLGNVRTYVKLLEGACFGYKQWIEGVRAGRTFISRGPVLFFQADGHGSGDTIDLPEASMVQIYAEAKGLLPFSELELVHDGQVTERASARDSEGMFTADLEIDLRIDRPGWLLVRCLATQPGTAVPHLAACASPIFVRVAGKLQTPDAAKLYSLCERVEKMLVWIETHGRFETDQQRQRMANVYLQAKQRLQEKLAVAQGSPGNAP